MLTNKYITAGPTKLRQVKRYFSRGLYLWQFSAAQWPWLLRTVWEAADDDPSHGASLLLENLGKNYNPPSACGSAQNIGVRTERRGISTIQQLSWSQTRLTIWHVLFILLLYQFTSIHYSLLFKPSLSDYNEISLGLPAWSTSRERGGGGDTHKPVLQHTRQECSQAQNHSLKDDPLLQGTSKKKIIIMKVWSLMFSNVIKGSLLSNITFTKHHFKVFTMWCT